MKIVSRPRLSSMGARSSRRSALLRGLERLEERRLLAISSVIQSTTGGPSAVVMTGDASADTLTIDLNGGDLQHNTLTAPAGQAYASNLDFDSTDPGVQTVTDGTLPVTINGGGNDSITLGDATTPVSSFLTSFTVNGTPGGNDSLTLDDSAADTPGGTIFINNEEVIFEDSSGNTLQTIPYGSIATLNVIASGQTIVVESTPAATALTLTNSGATSDVVEFGVPGSHSSQTVLGPVSLVSSGGSFAVTVDDSGDLNATGVAVTATSLFGLTGDGILFGSAALDYLSIFEGNAGNTNTIDGTPAIDVAGNVTGINGGTGTNTVDVLATGGEFAYIGQGGTDDVTLGSNGSLAGINGLVTISNTTPTTSLTIDDSADTTGQNALLNATASLGSLFDLAPASIIYSQAGLSSLDIETGTGGNTLTVDFSQGSPISTTLPLTFTGGAGSNTLDLTGGSFTNETYTASGPGAGTIDLDGSDINFSGLSPINDTSTATNYTFDAPPGAQAFNIVDGPVVGGYQTTQISSGDTPSAFELVNFANKTNVAINTAAQTITPTTNTIVLNNPTLATGQTNLTITAGDGTDQVTVTASPPSVATSITTGLTSSTFSVAAAGLGTGSSLSLNGGTNTIIDNTLTEDAGGGPLTLLTPPILSPSTPATIVINNGSPLYYTNLQAISIINLEDQPLTPIAETVSAKQGQPLTNVTVGSFTDADPNGAVGDYTATINWGDGTVTSGTISQPGGAGTAFDVQGSHTYLTSGTFPLSIAITDNGSSGTEDVGGVPVTLSDNGGSTTTIDSTADVSPAVVTGTGIPINAVEGNPFSGDLGTFTTSFPAATAADYTATINWGDGTPPSAGTITGPTGGPFTVSGTHTYAEETPPGKPDTFSVAITSARIGGTTITDTATVADAPLYPAVQPTVSVTQDTTFTLPVGAFVDLNPYAPLSDYSATINWGDGTSSAGFVTPFSPSGSSSNIITLPNGDPASLWLVSGTHDYGLPFGKASLTITVNDVGGSTTTIHNTATVAIDNVVTNTNDSGPHSLRYVIENLEDFEPDGTVVFDIPGTGPFVIHPLSPLPEIESSMTIDATTQPGYAGQPIVAISGDKDPNYDGLTLTAGDTTVKGLIIDNFTDGVGVVLQGPGGDVLENDWIGTNPTGTAAAPNYQGVLIQGSSNNTIIDNVISGNLSAGIQVFNSQTIDPTLSPAGPASGNVITGNLIGLGANGASALPNQQGVFLNDAANNSVINNVIATNKSIGVQILGENATGNLIQGNAIGGNRTGIYIYAGANTVGTNDFGSNTLANEQVRSLASGPVIESAVLTRDDTGVVTGLTLTFTTYLNPTTATNPNNYVVNLVGRNLSPGERIALASAPVYDNVDRSVTLSLKTYLPASVFFEVRVVGQSPNGITDRIGNFLDGLNILPAPRGGSDAVLYFRDGVQVNPIPTFPSKTSGKVVKTAGHAEAVLGAPHPSGRGVRSRR